MTTKTKAERAERLARIGALMYGPRWGNALADVMDVAKSRISMIRDGQRVVSDDMEVALVDVIRARRNELETIRQELAVEAAALCEEFGIEGPVLTDAFDDLRRAVANLFDVPDMTRVRVKEAMLDALRDVIAERNAKLEAEAELLPSAPTPSMGGM